MTFIEEIKERAKKTIKTIILPEAEDIRVLQATEKVIAEKYAKIILIFAGINLVFLFFHNYCSWSIIY